MKIFYDVEFVEDGRTINPISIGMVAEDGCEYYAVNSEMDTETIRKHQWLMGNVVPHLPLTSRGITRGMASGPSFSLDLKRTEMKPLWVIANEVRDFIQNTPDVELWSWYGAYDHVALCQLWGTMTRLPRGIPMWTNDLQQLRASLGNPEIPARANVEHHALANARYHRDIHTHLVSRPDGWATLDQLLDHIESAWGVIANSGVFGNPPEPTAGCREAAEKWRDEYHRLLGLRYPKRSAETSTDDDEQFAVTLAKTINRDSYRISQHTITRIIRAIRETYAPLTPDDPEALARVAAACWDSSYSTAGNAKKMVQLVMQAWLGTGRPNPTPASDSQDPPAAACDTCHGTGQVHQQGEPTGVHATDVPRPGCEGPAGA